MKISISETDAKTKWCPFARVLVVTKNRQFDFRPHNRVVFQEGNEGIPNPSDARCIASECMAWRWVRTHINNPADPKADLIPSDDTHGYCGLAGAPSKL